MNDEALRQRVQRVMQWEMICSEHGALCYIEAARRDRPKARRAKNASRKSGGKNKHG